MSKSLVCNSFYVIMKKLFPHRNRIARKVVIHACEIDNPGFALLFSELGVRDGTNDKLWVRATGDRYQVLSGFVERQHQDASVQVCLVYLTDQEVALCLTEQVCEASAVHIAKIYRLIMQCFGWSQSDLARAIGVNRSVVCNRIKLLSLPKVVQRYLTEGLITEGHAKWMLALEKDEQRKVADKAVKNQWSVQILRQYIKGNKKVEKGGEKSFDQIRLENQLTDLLGSKVVIDTNESHQGYLKIQAHSFDELEGLAQKFNGGKVSAEIVIGLKGLDDLDRVLSML